jgi:hypothetical protein
MRPGPAFHIDLLSLADFDLPEQLLLMLHGLGAHPNGQIPAHSGTSAT